MDKLPVNSHNRAMLSASLVRMFPTSLPLGELEVDVPKHGTKAAPQNANTVELRQLANLTAEASALLIQAGIDDRRKLEEIGAVGAYMEMYRQGLKPAMNLLYVIEGALRDVPWTQLPHHVRASITLEADAMIESERKS